MANRVDQTMEKTILASRWLKAPMDMGLVVTFGMLAIMFAREIVGYSPYLMGGRG